MQYDIKLAYSSSNSYRDKLYSGTFSFTFFLCLFVICETDVNTICDVLGGAQPGLSIDNPKANALTVHGLGI